MKKSSIRTHTHRCTQAHTLGLLCSQISLRRTPLTHTHTYTHTHIQTHTHTHTHTHTQKEQYTHSCQDVPREREREEWSGTLLFSSHLQLLKSELTQLCKSLSR